MKSTTTETTATVTLPRRDYEALVRRAELAEDIAAIRGMVSEADLLPAPLVRRLVKGESPVKVFRQHRGIAQTALAKAAGVGKSHLSQIEAGRKSPSLAVLKALAAALAVDIDDLA